MLSIATDGKCAGWSTGASLLTTPCLKVTSGLTVGLVISMLPLVADSTRTSPSEHCPKTPVLSQVLAWSGWLANACLD